jgi:hypothetical protein
MFSDIHGEFCTKIFNEIHQNFALNSVCYLKSLVLHNKNFGECERLNAHLHKQ